MYRALAATDVSGDVLAGVTGEHHFQDLSVPQRELGDLGAAAESYSEAMSVHERLLDRELPQ